MYSLRTMLAFSLVCLYQQTNCLWPTPKNLEQGSSVCWISPELQLDCQSSCQSSIWDKLQQIFPTISPKNHRNCQKTTDRAEDAVISSAFERLKETIHSHAFVPWKFHQRDADYQPGLRQGHLAYVTSIHVEQSRLVASSESNEAYSLRVSEDCKVLIRINHPLGAIRAFDTLTQLFHRHSDQEDAIYLDTAPVALSDAPAFAHRGLNLDISRNIISPQEVMKTIDGLAFNKFNRLHLHASDAQSWVLEIPSIPELAARGAYHKSQIWSVDDLGDVHEFGAARGVEVYIEIDMPGHTASIQESYPNLLTSFNRKPWEKYSAQPPSGQLKLNNTEVNDFITTLLNDLLPRTQPYSPFFHLGGDEITASAYDMTLTELQPYLQAFMDQAFSLVHSLGLTPIIWEEHVLDYNITLPRDTIVQAWRGATADNPSSLAQLVSKGHRAIFGSNDHWYLDCGLGGWIDRDVHNPNSPIKPPFLDYCAPYKNWREVLSYDPLADIPESQRHLVVGGEVHLWGEQTDGMNLDSNLWPRVAAAGEVLWRGKGTVGEEATRGLAGMREWLVNKGMRAGPVQVTWCLMNPGNCVS